MHQIYPSPTAFATKNEKTSNNKKRDAAPNCTSCYLAYELLKLFVNKFSIFHKIILLVKVLCYFVIEPIV